MLEMVFLHVCYVGRAQSLFTIPRLSYIPPTANRQTALMWQRCEYRQRQSTFARRLRCSDAGNDIVVLTDGTTALNGNPLSTATMGRAVVNRIPDYLCLMNLYYFPATMVL